MKLNSRNEIKSSKAMQETDEGRFVIAASLHFWPQDRAGAFPLEVWLKFFVSFLPNLATNHHI